MIRVALDTRFIAGSTSENELLDSDLGKTYIGYSTIWGSNNA
jgi:hypothetical protein